MSSRWDFSSSVLHRDKTPKSRVLESFIMAASKRSENQLSNDFDALVSTRMTDKDLIVNDDISHL